MGLIRLLLAFSVLAGHAGVLHFEILDGDIAVRAFFVISGFYMSLILTGGYAGRPKSVFYANRALRLYPAYLLVMAAQAAALMAWDFHPFTTRDTLLFAYTNGPLIPVVNVLTNLFVVGQEALYWLGMDIRGGSFFWNAHGGPAIMGFTFTMLPQAWALSVEFMFYLIAPFLAPRRTGLLLALFLAGLAIHVLIPSAFPNFGDFSQRFFPAQFYLFAAGMLGFRLYRRVRDLDFVNRAGWVLLAAVIAHVFCYDLMGGAYRDHTFVTLAAAATPFVFRLSERSGLDRFLGRVSYPFYLLHFMVAEIYSQIAVDYSPLGLVLLVFSLSVIVLLAVEYPIDRYRRRKYRMSGAIPPFEPPPVKPRVSAA